ncbi:hypothetical protein D9M71_403430 [compost metagenome]
MCSFSATNLPGAEGSRASDAMVCCSRRVSLAIFCCSGSISRSTFLRASSRKIRLVALRSIQSSPSCTFSMALSNVDADADSRLSTTPRAPASTALSCSATSLDPVTTRILALVWLCKSASDSIQSSLSRSSTTTSGAYWCSESRYCATDATEPASANLG